jgi:hypothetical protein
MTDLRNFCGKLEEHWISQDQRDQTEAIMEKLSRSQMSTNSMAKNKLNSKVPLGQLQPLQDERDAKGVICQINEGMFLGLPFHTFTTWHTPLNKIIFPGLQFLVPSYPFRSKAVEANFKT